VTAIQIAKALGHRVFVTAGNDEKCQACEKLGAERAINYNTEDFVDVVKSLTNDRGCGCDSRHGSREIICRVSEGARRRWSRGDNRDAGRLEG